MSISGVSSIDSLATLATQMKGSEVNSQIAVAILKQTQDSQQQFADALVKMINQTPSLDGTGQKIDVSA